MRRSAKQGYWLTPFHLWNVCFNPYGLIHLFHYIHKFHLWNVCFNPSVWSTFWFCQQRSVCLHLAALAWPVYTFLSDFKKSQNCYGTQGSYAWLRLGYVYCTLQTFCTYCMCLVSSYFFSHLIDKRRLPTLPQSLRSQLWIVRTVYVYHQNLYVCFKCRKSRKNT